MTAAPTATVETPRLDPANMCLPLDAPSDAALVGGKAQTLGRMLRAGIAVPDGFVLTTRAFDAFLSESGLDVESDDRESARAAAIPRCVREQLAGHASLLLARGPVVVRSSAVGEDGAMESFAGQLDSVLHVRDEESLERALLDVWSSFWSERVLFYRKARRLPARGMGVVVQHQVDALAAGVMFTACHPERSDARHHERSEGSAFPPHAEMLVEYAPGLADALVAGAVDPGRVAIDRETGAARHLARQSSFTLDAHHIADLRTVGLRLEAELGAPQDVEWAIDASGALFIVQSRPITVPVTIPTVPPFHRSTVPPPNRSTVSWSNANVSENFPRPISPLLYSIAAAGYTHYFRNLAIAFGVSSRRVRAMEPAFRQIIGTHGARMYYNLTSIHSVLRLAPFGKALATSFDVFTGADGRAVDAEPAAHTGRLRQTAEVAVIAYKAMKLFSQLDHGITRFERTVRDFAERTEPARLASMSLLELGDALSDFMEIRCHRWLDASLADAAAMISYALLERLLRRAYPDRALHTSLLKAIPGVVSGEPVLHLWDLSRRVRADFALETLIRTAAPADFVAVIHADARFADFRVAFQAYLDDWGFRCSEELMLTSPSFQEQPEPLVEMIRAYALATGDSPRDMLRAQALERERETRRVVSELSPTLAALLELLLPFTHTAIRYRERARLHQALLYSRCRRIALAIGEALVRRDALAERDDVFFLTHTELTDVAGGGAMLPHATRAIVAARKAEHARLSALTPPDAFTLEEGAYLDDAQPVATHRPRAEDGRLRATPACGGKVTGRATILRSVTEAAQLAQGDVLVTKQTDPGWGPVFFLISGLVIERGGMLSHGAIIAREFGIPCVVGLEDAMNRIPSGATITVDGDAGEVHVVA